jgi:hypothetical protein
LVYLEAAVVRNIHRNILNMAWACVYAAEWMSLLIYFDRRERERERDCYTGGYSNISDNSSAWASISVNKSGPTDV